MDCIALDPVLQKKIFKVYFCVSMTRLSVNINKIAWLRNARGGNVPDVVQCAIDIQKFGAEGITVHPRPDERHIRYKDVFDLKKIINTEFNIEGNPKEKKFVDLVLANKPDQVTLVPDAQAQITSDHGWDIKNNMDFLKEIISVFKNAGIRTSIFIDPDPHIPALAKETGTDRVELYTESYASAFERGERQTAIDPFIATAKAATDAGLRMNAGHDLNLQNLQFFIQHIPQIAEVSIGHALISDALYFGLENTVQLYKRKLLR